MAKINYKNYFEDSRGSFKSINITENYMKQKFSYMGEVWEHNFSSQDKYTGEIRSIYYINKRKTKLLRISDHWSIAENPDVFCCGHIRECYWELEGESLPVYDDFYAGMIEFREMSPVWEEEEEEEAEEENYLPIRPPRREIVSSPKKEKVKRTVRRKPA